MSGSSEEEKRRRGIPRYFYWAKAPPKPKRGPMRFVNAQQKKFYLVQLAFRAAQIGAIVAVFLIYSSLI